MADRTVTAYLKANVTGLTSGLATGAAAVKGFSSGLTSAAAQNSAGFTTMGVAAGGAGLAIVAGIGAAVSSFVQFDSAMSNVQAATHESAASMDLLRDAALQAGADTAFSATEAAAGIEELAKAGISTADIMGGALTGALDLAAAGGISVGEAAETTASALTQFGLEGTDASHVADLLAAGAGKAQGTVSDMGAALNQSGLVASQFGLSIEETTGSLAMFASAGLTGSDAGTSLRTMLLRLTNPSGEAAATMKDLGINVYDAQGQFVGMEGIAGQLQTSMGGLDEATRNAALGTIFGSDAIRAASILYKGGAAGVAEWTAKVDDSGYAAETAALRMDNLAGDLEKLKGSFETALIGLGAAADGPLRSLTQALTGAVNAFSELPAGAQSATLAVAALAAGVLLLGGGFLVLLPRIAATQAAMATLGITAAGVGAAIGTATALIAGLAAVFVGMNLLDPAQNIDALKESLTGLADTGAVTGALAMIDSGLIGTVNSVGDLDQVLQDATGEMNNWWDAADSLVGTSAKEDIAGIDQAFADMASNGQAGQAAEGFQMFIESAARAGVTTDELIALFPQYTAGLESTFGANMTLAESIDASIAAQEQQNAALSGTAQHNDIVAEKALMRARTEVEASEIAQGAIEAELGELEGLISAYQNLNNANLTSLGTVRAYEQAVDDLAAMTTGLVEEFGSLDEALLDNGTGFDNSTQAGRDLAAQTETLGTTNAATAQSVYDLAEANKEDLPAAYAVLQSSLTSARADLVESMVQMGINRESAEVLAAKIIEIPDRSDTQIAADNAQALAATQAAQDAIDRMAGTTEILDADNGPLAQAVGIAQSIINSLTGRTVNNYVYTHHIDLGGGGAGGVAYGGRIGGHSPNDRADNIPMMLTAGEYVLPVSAVRALDRDYGTGFLEGLRNGRVSAGARAPQRSVQFPTYMAAPAATGGGGQAPAAGHTTNFEQHNHYAGRRDPADAADSARDLLDSFAGAR